MDGEATGAMALLKKLRGKMSGKGETEGSRKAGRRAADEDAAPPAADPALHPGHRAGRARLLPDAAVLAGRLRGEHRNMVRCWSTATPTARARRAARPLKVGAPVEYPEVGVYHPRMKQRMAESDGRDAAARGHQRRAGTVGLLLLRSYLLAGNAAHYDGVIAALEARGLRSCRPSPAGSTRARRSSASS
jgi:magnesium chelatase subunit H